MSQPLKQVNHKIVTVIAETGNSQPVNVTVEPCIQMDGDKSWDLNLLDLLLKQGN
jgi:hypothetical protein